MPNIMSLAHVSEGEEAVFIAGIRATALAQTARAGYATPLAFVISCQLYETFLEQSGLTQWITHLYNRLPNNYEGYEEAYVELKKLFSQIQFSGNLREEFLEAYESLAVDATSDMDTLVTNEADPRVRIIPSPDYQSNIDFSLAVQQNIKGEYNFLQAIMKTWLSYFKAELVAERKEKGMDIDDFKVALLIEQEAQTEFSAEGFYTKARAAHPIKILSYKGVLDTLQKTTKDEHLLANDPLDVVKTTVRHQEQKNVFGEQSGQVELVEVGLQGINQKLHIRTLLELGRLTKRAHITLGKDVHCYFSIQGDKVKLISVEPKTSEQQTMNGDFGQQVTKTTQLENFPLTSVPLPKKSLSDQEVGEHLSADDLLRATIPEQEIETTISTIENSYVQDSDMSDNLLDDMPDDILDKDVLDKEFESLEQYPATDTDEQVDETKQENKEVFVSVETLLSSTESPRGEHEVEMLEPYEDANEVGTVEQFSADDDTLESLEQFSADEKIVQEEERPEFIEVEQEEKEEREGLGIIFMEEENANREPAQQAQYKESAYSTLQKTEQNISFPQQATQAEETLFDLFTSENEEPIPILPVVEKEKRTVSPEAAKTAANIFVRQVSNTIKSYQRKGIPILSEREMLLLNAFENRLLQGEEASDVMIGLAWRAQHLINLLD